MGFTDGLLIVVVILLLYCAITQSGPQSMKNRAWDCIDRSSGAYSQVTMKMPSVGGQAAGQAAQAPMGVGAKAEAGSTGEHLEYFATCQNSMLDPPAGACNCADATNGFEYAKNDFGTKDSDYTSWVMSQTLDPAIIANHKEFIQDRTGEDASVNILGRTYTPADSHSSYTPLSSAGWLGIRGRFSLAPICSPDKVSDDNLCWYPKEMQLQPHSGKYAC